MKFSSVKKERLVDLLAQLLLPGIPSEVLSSPNRLESCDVSGWSWFGILHFQDQNWTESCLRNQMCLINSLLFYFRSMNVLLLFINYVKLLEYYTNVFQKSCKHNCHDGFSALYLQFCNLNFTQLRRQSDSFTHILMMINNDDVLWVIPLNLAVLLSLKEMCMFCIVSN